MIQSIPVDHPKSSTPTSRLADLSEMPIDATESLKATIAELRDKIARLNREQNKVQDLLSSLGFALRSFNNLNQFLELTPLMAARVADAEGGALILYKQDGQIRLEQLHCAEGQAACQTVRRAIEQVTLRTTQSRSPQEVDFDESLDIDQQIQVHLGPDVQLCGTSILVKNVERGKLYVFSGDSDYRWNVNRRKLVQLVADQTAVAIANNDLTLELRQKERQDRELAIASEIQTHLLPSKCPQIHGLAIAAQCHNAHRVGGDYYDFIPTNYDQLYSNSDPKTAQCVPWSIVIGDVMGKGVPAALIMTMTRGMLRAEILGRHSPGKILEHLNRVMYADLDNSHRFVTLFYSEYDPKTRILSFSNAAHHPPLRWQANSQQIKTLDTKGMLIGLEADSHYEDAQVQLEIGDIILYYTDGFTDAVNARGERFDEENLRLAFQQACQSCKTPQEILNDLFAKVQAFIYPNLHNGDDMTLVVIKVESDALPVRDCFEE